jgi:gluconate 5-dehydrogenase
MPASPAELFDLTGRRALVTGSTRGIGAAVLDALAGAGATVVRHGRDRQVAEAANARLAAALGTDERLHAVGFDVADTAAMEAAVTELEQRLGGIDILVNNAGIQHRAPVLEFSLPAWEQVLAVNLTACFALSQRLAGGMVERGYGKIINICSVQNKLVRNATAAYAAAKSALGTLGQVMCADWARHGIQINGVAPGYIATDLNAALLDDEAFTSWVVGRTPAARWGTPEDISGPVLWLASPAADFVNGQVIYVDGGLTAVM